MLVVMELIGLNYTFGVHDGLKMFIYYTDSSNVLCLIVSGLFVVFMLPALSKGRTSGFVSTYMMQHYKGSSEMPRWITMIRYISTCCLMLTFLVVLFVLGPKKGYADQLLKGVHPIDHVLAPVLSLLSFLFLEISEPLPKKAPVYAIIPTLIYAVILIAMNAAGLADGPYFFLRVREQSLVRSVLWTMAILVGNYLISWLIMKGYNRMIPIPWRKYSK
ncbi:hypothetical protein UYO_0321 [Lachnospiraceae bacterium JC7]|nr:hypothetical protein UYO_0321 [Lachnospiraceae bacterium JC7]